MVSYLIDTNAISELKKRRPHPGVADWFAAHSGTSLYISVLTLGELRKGIEAMENGPRKADFRDWLQLDLAGYFSGRILNIDAHVADRWGQLLAEAGRPLPAIDSLLAATALEYGLTLVTRNLVDFRFLGLQLINPWAKAAHP